MMLKFLRAMNTIELTKTRLLKIDGLFQKLFSNLGFQISVNLKIEEQRLETFLESCHSL